MQPGCKETSKRLLRQDQGRRIGPEATGRAQDIGRDRSGSEEQKGHRDELIVASRVIDGQGVGKSTITNAYISSLGIEPYILRQLGHETLIRNTQSACSFKAVVEDFQSISTTISACALYDMGRFIAHHINIGRSSVLALSLSSKPRGSFLSDPGANASHPCSAG